jgi:hypothetical protein
LENHGAGHGVFFVLPILSGHGASLLAAQQMNRAPNHTIQRMGANHSGHWQYEYLRRLAPTADGDRQVNRA